jgi:hypothetical protein
MRWWLSTLLIAGLAGLAAAQEGMEMQAPPPVMLDCGACWTADGSQVLFSRVTTNQAGQGWLFNIVAVPQPVFQMPGTEGGEFSGGMEGEMKPVEPEYRREGVFRVPATGGQAQQIIGGRALIQDANNTYAVVLFQGMGAAQYRSWGVYGLELSGNNSTLWYQAVPTWARVSPDGRQFVLPHPKAPNYVFFPVAQNSRQFSGYCATTNTGRPAIWAPDSSGVWTAQVGPDGNWALGIGQPDQKFNKIVDKVGPNSFAVSIPGSTDVWVSAFMPVGVEPWPVKLWPGDPSGLYLYDAQGHVKRKVTVTPAAEMQASPDGKLLAFVYGTAPYGLAVVSVDGGPVRRLSSQLIGGMGFTRSFAWSPDSKKIAFGGLDVDKGHGVFVVDVDTADVTRLSTVPIIKK